MKIGIVTQPLHNNYGGLLQNYALQQVLKRLGHEPKTIDYMYRIPLFLYLKFIFKQIIKLIFRVGEPHFYAYKMLCDYRKPIVVPFVENYISKTKTVHKYSSKIVHDEQFDAIITGSDQVWRPIYNKSIEDMFLKFVPDHIRKVAFAASFGVDSWEYNPMQTKCCAKLSKSFNAISVREESGVRLCNQYLEVESECVLDPTILAGAEAFTPLVKKNVEENYLFAYILDITEEKQAYVENIAKSKGLKTIIASADRNANLSPDQWVSMIANASIVITDSFHGTIFSILFHREFLSIVNKSRGATRFVSLLVPLGLESRMVDMSQFQFTQHSVIDWKQVDNTLAVQREKSINFLLNALG